jgi:hypothetical protein
MTPCMSRIFAVARDLTERVRVLWTRSAKPLSPVQLVLRELGFLVPPMIREGPDGNVCEAWSGHHPVPLNELERQAHRRIREAERAGDPRVAQWRTARARARAAQHALAWQVLPREPRRIARRRSTLSRASRRARRACRVASQSRAGPEDGPPPRPHRRASPSLRRGRP